MESEHNTITPCVPELREAPIVRQLTVERARVELEVAGVDDGPHRRVDRQSDAVDDRVRDADRLDAERAGLEAVARADHAKVRRLDEPVLLQSLRHERQGQGRAVHGHRRLAQQVRECADVILVAVGQDDRAERFTPAEHVREIGDDVVDPGELVVGEHESAVDRDQVLAGLDQHHVEADLAETSQGNQSDDGLHGTPFTTGLILPSTSKFTVVSRSLAAWSRRDAKPAECLSSAGLVG